MKFKYLLLALVMMLSVSSVHAQWEVPDQQPTVKEPSPEPLPGPVNEPAPSYDPAPSYQPAPEPTYEPAPTPGWPTVPEPTYDPTPYPQPEPVPPPVNHPSPTYEPTPTYEPAPTYDPYPQPNYPSHPTSPYPTPNPSLSPNYGTEDIRCESNGNRLKLCPGKFVKEVYRLGIVKNLSSKSCVRNKTYGVTYDYKKRRTLFVDRGCRAVFRVEGYRKNP